MNEKLEAALQPGYCDDGVGGAEKARRRWWVGLTLSSSFTFPFREEKDVCVNRKTFSRENSAKACESGLFPLSRKKKKERVIQYDKGERRWEDIAVWVGSGKEVESSCDD